MAPSGRKRDPIWAKFDELPVVLGKTGRRVRCKICGKEMQSLTDRMKKHVEGCPGTEAEIATENQNTPGIEIPQCVPPHRPSAHRPLALRDRYKNHKNQPVWRWTNLW